MAKSKAKNNRSLAKRSAFVNPDAQVGIEDEEGNTIYIRAKMGLYIQSRVEDEKMKVQLTVGDEADDAGMFTISLSQENRILAENNILGWSGPMFEYEDGGTVPCNRNSIRQLDPNLPLLLEAIENVRELNYPRVGDPFNGEVEKNAPLVPEEDTSES